MSPCHGSRKSSSSFLFSWVFLPFVSVLSSSRLVLVIGVSLVSVIGVSLMSIDISLTVMHSCSRHAEKQEKHEFGRRPNRDGKWCGELSQP